MKRQWRLALGIGLPVLAIVVFLSLLSFSLLRLATIQETMRLRAPHNMLWVISQAEGASFRLSTTVARRASGNADAAMLERRYNVFMSRIHLLQQGPQRRQMQHLGFADELQNLRPQLRQMQNHIKTLQPHDVSAARAIGALLDKYNTLLGHAATQAMVSEWDMLGGKIDVSRRQMRQIFVSLVGILVAGIILILHFLFATREARRHTRLLNKEKAFSQRVISSSGEGIVAIDLQQQCTVWNKAAEELFQRPARRAIGHPLSDISGFFQAQRVKRAIRTSLDGQPAALLDQSYYIHDRNASRYLDLRCFTLWDDEAILGALFLVSDVTERRAAQRELAMHRDHLEERVQARTRELDAALEREKATAELYRNFGAMISHQFRTPLAIVDSALQRLIRRRDTVDAAEIRERGDRARAAITRMTELIESTLDAARFDAGQIDSRSRPCNIAQLAAELCERQRDHTGERTMALVTPPRGTAIAYCDLSHAEHILTNLLSNACKYSPPNSPIDVRISHDEGEVECAVSNHGDLSGIPDSSSLFERYYRGDNARGHTGVGIGLYMARALARLQYGDVHIENTVPGIVTFVLRLPQHTPQPATTTARMEPA